MYKLLLVSMFVSQGILAQFQEVEYRGRDKNTNAPCKLYVTGAGFMNQVQSPENYFLNVLPRGFSHDGDSSGPFTLKPVAGKPNILHSHNGADEMVLFFENGDFLTGVPSGFNVKWLHGNHYHYDACRELQRK